eukprot:jgi/Mesvir1/15693/Mv03284-RA.1
MALRRVLRSSSTVAGDGTAARLSSGRNVSNRCNSRGNVVGVGHSSRQRSTVDASGQVVKFPVKDGAAPLSSTNPQVEERWGRDTAARPSAAKSRSSLDERTVVVKNVSYDMSEEAMAEELRSRGFVPDSICYAYDTAGAFRGTAFLKFSTVEEAGWMVSACQGIEVSGRCWAVEEYVKGRQPAAAESRPTAAAEPTSKLFRNNSPTKPTAPLDMAAQVADAVRVAETILESIKSRDSEKSNSSTPPSHGSPAQPSSPFQRPSRFSTPSSQTSGKTSCPPYTPPRQPRGPNGTLGFQFPRTTPAVAM